jgi:hypothetical protein
MEKMPGVAETISPGRHMATEADGEEVGQLPGK